MAQLKQRMYFLVMYNLSEIQKGIQAGHAQNEYQLIHGADLNYVSWAEFDKTWMVMNGGTSNQTGTNKYNDDFQLGSMENHQMLLINMNIKHACFYEPDLNNALSAIAFLADERCWDREKYPTQFAPNPGLGEIPIIDINERMERHYQEEIKAYGSEIAFMRKFIYGLKFA